MALCASNKSLFTIPVDCVYRSCTKLGGPAVPCTPGVRPLYRSSMFTKPWITICSEQHLCTPTVCICTAASSRFRTALVGCVSTNCTKLRGPFVLVHHVYDSQIAHGSSSSCVEQSVGNGIFVHLQCGSVQLPTVGLRTALSGCVYTNCTKLRGPIAPGTPGV